MLIPSSVLSQICLFPDNSHFLCHLECSHDFVDLCYVGDIPKIGDLIGRVTTYDESGWPDEDKIAINFWSGGILGMIMILEIPELID